MAKRPPEPRYAPAELSIDQIDRAIPRIEKRIADLRGLDLSQGFGGIRASIEQTLEEIFGAYSTEYKRYSPAAIISGGPIIIGGGRSIDHRPYYERSRASSIALLEQAIKGLAERREDLARDVQNVELTAVEEKVREFSHRVFVVHGRDGEPREAVARFLQQLGLEAVILHEQPNKGRALITKFQEVADDIGFAIVLMTPDDVGGLDGDGQQHPRARQNVIFELGFFIGALGPDRVAALVSPQVERPSDFEGVVYLPLEGEWRLPLCRELRAAGYEVDLNKVL